MKKNASPQRASELKEGHRELQVVLSVALHFFSEALCGLKVSFAGGGYDAISYSIDLISNKI